MSDYTVSSISNQDIMKLLGTQHWDSECSNAKQYFIWNSKEAELLKEYKVVRTSDYSFLEKDIGKDTWIKGKKVGTFTTESGEYYTYLWRLAKTHKPKYLLWILVLISWFSVTGVANYFVIHDYNLIDYMAFFIIELMLWALFGLPQAWIDGE